ncbi:hypothetical protein AHAS_Ahas06G0277400 [Arachis hypogaea]
MFVLFLSRQRKAVMKSIARSCWFLKVSTTQCLDLRGQLKQVEKNLRHGVVDADGEDDTEAVVKSTTPHMFCKTLTASDTSTHGGFSVPRRAAEDCFPPLDYSQQRPSQELVAKDLHGLEWRFRHIYRGISFITILMCLHARSNHFLSFYEQGSHGDICSQLDGVHL